MRQDVERWQPIPFQRQSAKLKFLLFAEKTQPCGLPLKRGIEPALDVLPHRFSLPNCPSRGNPLSMDETTDAAILPEPVLAYEQRTVSPYVIVWCRLLAIICFGFGVERGLLFFGVALFGTGYSFSRGAAWPSIASGVVFCTLWPVTGVCALSSLPAFLCGS
jgi:hypothetical protein